MELLHLSDQNLFSAEESALCPLDLKPSSSHGYTCRHFRIFHSTYPGCTDSADLRAWTGSSRSSLSMSRGFCSRNSLKKVSDLMGEIKFSKKPQGLSDLQGEGPPAASTFTCLGTVPFSFPFPAGFSFLETRQWGNANQTQQAALLRVASLYCFCRLKKSLNKWLKIFISSNF